MRVSDLQPDTEYATCNGELVLPLEPIHGNWYWLFDHKKAAWKLVDGGDDRKANQDPWAPCHKRKPGQPAQRRTKAGVLVLVFQYDRLGKRIEGTGERVVLLPKDIAGPWKEYLTLYADVVAERVDSKERERQRDEAVAEIKRHFAAKHGVHPDDVSLWKRNKNDCIEVNFTVRVPVPSSKAKNPPDEYVRVAERLRKRG